MFFGFSRLRDFAIDTFKELISDGSGSALPAPRDQTPTILIGLAVRARYIAAAVINSRQACRHGGVFCFSKTAQAKTVRN